MAHSKSAAKRWRQNLKLRARNRAAKATLKTLGKNVRAAATGGDATKAAEEFKVTVKRIDQTAAKGIIHPNKAARLKSRLSKALKTAKTAPPAPAKKK